MGGCILLTIIMMSFAIVNVDVAMPEFVGYVKTPKLASVTQSATRSATLPGTTPQRDICIIPLLIAKGIMYVTSAWKK